MVCYTCAMSLADLGLIGNCQLAAHVRRDGAIVWCCMPRFDSAPIFGALLDDDGGQFTIGPATPGLGLQRYLANTNVLETRFEVLCNILDTEMRAKLDEIRGGVRAPFAAQRLIGRKLSEAVVRLASSIAGAGKRTR